MIARRGTICFSCFLAATLFAAWLLPLPPAHAEQAFLRFTPLLVDLGGWDGKKPEGMSMEMPNNSMTTATRDYRRGSAQLHVAVIVGQAAAGALAPTRTGMNIETSDGHVITSTINGLPVTKTYNIKQKSGAILIALGASALLSVSYDGLTEDEALQLAQKFDWKAIQAAAQAK
jgi:hypothetical protein